MRDALGYQKGQAPPLLRVLRFVVYLLALTPLVFWQPLMYFFEQTKGFYVVFIVQVLFLFFGWMLYAHPLFRPRLGGIGVALVVFISILFVTSIFGADFSFSFWGEADRVTGLFYWMHLLVIFVVLVNILPTRDDWVRFLFFSVCVALIVAVIQSLAMLGVYEIPSSRQGATLGNSTYLAVYLLFHIFFALFVAFSGIDRRRKLFGFFAAAFLSFIVVFPNDAHAVVFALFGALIFLVSRILLFQAKVSWQINIGRGLLGGLVGGCILAGVLLLQPQSALRQYALDLSSGARFIVWDIAWQGVKERPIFGWGLESFSRVFFDHYNPCLGSPVCGGEMFYDRAHNKILDVWIEAGFLGLIAYVALFFVAIGTLFKIARMKNGGLPAAALLALLAGYFVQNLTALDVSITLLFFVITLALIQSLSFSYREPLPTHTTPGRPMIAVLATVAYFFAFFFFFVQPIRASLAVTALDTVSSSEQRAELYDRAADASPFGQRARRSYIAYKTLGWLVLNGRAAVERNPLYIRQEMQRTEKSLVDQLERTDFDPRLYTLLGTLYQLEGRFFDGVGFERARQVFEKGMARHPFNPKPAWAMLSLYLELGEFENAVVLAQTVVDRAAGISEAHYNQLVVDKFVSDPDTFAQQAREVAALFPKLAGKIQILVAVDLDEGQDDLLSLPGRF